jgi:transposase-like protein
MKNQLKDDRVIKRFSEAFKHKVLESIRSGRLSKREASRNFGVSTGSISKWIRAYDCSLYNIRIRVEDINEKDRLKALQSRIAELERALADSQVQQFKSRAYLQVAAEKLGYPSWEDFQKKNDRPPYTGQ